MIQKRGQKRVVLENGTEIKIWDTGFYILGPMNLPPFEVMVENFIKHLEACDAAKEGSDHAV
ncbi:hypothetical protein [Roseivirga thermotolerans]|uniref:Uncharacterized protein n=1 Tax=Roseivirga thermotolerans TaxID=1758176 RepID=A0ABQ3I8P6_9BACT|nr:hypothetical protein [Roseivirga thermotolerans]GHE65086.1 hypothetical protein GCM10011340_20160 [Roseivirga thermotolerans]